MVLTFFTLIWRFVKCYTIVCVACSLVVYGLSFIGCGINFLVKYILVCAECCLLTVAFHCLALFHCFEAGCSCLIVCVILQKYNKK